MSQDYLAIRDQVRDIVKAVPNVFIVNGFPRIEATNQAARWKEFMTTNDRIDAWTVLRDSAPTVLLGTCTVQVQHNVTVRGMLELNDELSTQDEFDALIDAIMQALYPRVNLSQTVTFQGPAQLEVEDIRIFADTIVHYAEINLVAFQNVDVTTTQ